MLEGLAARLATERATDDDLLRSLQGVLDDHARVVEVGDEDANVELDTRFHSDHPRGGGNDDLSMILAGSRAERTCPASRCGGPSATPATPRRAPGDLRRHGRACPDGAERAARQHISNLIGGSEAPASVDRELSTRAHDDDRDRTPEARSGTGQTGGVGDSGVPARRHAQGHRQLRLLVRPPPAGGVVGRHAAQPAPAGAHRPPRHHRRCAVPGVAAVLTHEDVPGEKTYGMKVADQPVLAFDEVRYQGEAVAIVAADHPEIAPARSTRSSWSTRSCRRSSIPRSRSPATAASSIPDGQPRAPRAHPPR